MSRVSSSRVPGGRGPGHAGRQRRLGPGRRPGPGAAGPRRTRAPTRLTFGPLEPLVALMQETPADKLLPILVEKLKDGTDLRELVAAAALANARTFGGQDYVGYHTFMALAPPTRWPASCPRPSGRCRCSRCSTATPTASRRWAAGRTRCCTRSSRPRRPTARPGGEALREATRKQDMDGAERTFAALAGGPLDEAFNDLQYLVQDDVERPPRRPGLAGLGHARPDRARSTPTRCCASRSASAWTRRATSSKNRLGRPAAGPPAEAARPVPAAGPARRRPAAGRRLGRAAGPDDLRRRAASRPPTRSPRPWPRGSRPRRSARRSRWRRTSSSSATPAAPKADAPGKPRGSVHGDSVGVHASDAANAWRNIARVSNPRNARRQPDRRRLPHGRAGGRA